jgi:hypothetical protein
MGVSGPREPGSTGLSSVSGHRDRCFPEEPLMLVTRGKQSRGRFGKLPRCPGALPVSFPTPSSPLIVVVTPTVRTSVASLPRNRLHRVRNGAVSCVPQIGSIAGPVYRHVTDGTPTSLVLEGFCCVV